VAGPHRFDAGVHVTGAAVGLVVMGADVVGDLLGVADGLAVGVDVVGLTVGVDVMGDLLGLADGLAVGVDVAGLKVGVDVVGALLGVAIGLGGEEIPLMHAPPYCPPKAALQHSNWVVKNIAA